MLFSSLNSSLFIRQLFPHRRFFCFSAFPQPIPLAFDAYPSTAEPEKTNPLVIVHGLFGHKQNWRGVAKALQKELGNRVFVLDLRNHGESPHLPQCTYSSMASDLRQFLEKEVFTVSVYKTAFLLGHSMGGKVVSEFAFTKVNENLIEKLIVEDIAPQRNSHSSLAQFRAYIQSLRSVDLRLSRSEISRSLDPKIPEETIRAFLLTNLYKPRGGPFKWRCNLDALSDNLEHIFDPLISRERVTVPTLFLHGANSTYFLEDDKIALRKIFSHANFEEIPEAGHWLHAEQPQRFIDSVTKFLKKGYFTYDE
ncbi:hypothetical protein niasHT_004681 [Heterodera trifolii]|uniref:sn-1-specific diacylglycerol lipase ABHD11 n=1 Tax=Heterodera trifolii TaxID=157864 RepID=A0ABD2MAP0_9BILA